MDNKIISKFNLVLLIAYSLFSINYIIFHRGYEYTGEWGGISIAIFSILFVVAPLAVMKITGIKIDGIIYTTFLFFVFIAYGLANGLRFYSKFDWWDDFAHTLFGVVGALGAAYLYTYLQPNCKSKAVLLLFVFTIPLAIGVFWELIEYTVDVLFWDGQGLQRIKESLENSPYGSWDSVHDLYVSVLGAAVVAIGFILNSLFPRYSFIVGRYLYNNDY